MSMLLKFLSLNINTGMDYSLNWGEKKDKISKFTVILWDILGKVHDTVKMTSHSVSQKK